jgi:hypothetical protein
MAEGMEIFFKKINLLPSLNNLLENDTKKNTLKSLFNSANLNFFQHLPQSSRMQSVKKLAINIRCCNFLVHSHFEKLKKKIK